jgi:hypothetical protein
MSDEQIIYIGPEDDLTNIRERLEKAQSKRVTLVIPANTQLRSHVAWKLLYRSARELGKEVLIVSSDAQIRSVAHGVKFRVATSLEASSASSPAKPRPVNRPSRAPAGAKSRSASTGSMRSAGGRADSRGIGSSTRTRHPSTPGPWYHRADERSLARPDLEAESRPSQPEDLIAEGIEDLPPVKRFGSTSYSSHSPHIDSVDSVPSIHPLPPEQSDEAPDYQIDEEDFRTAREIREAALGSRQFTDNSSADAEETDERPSARSQPSAAPRNSNLPQIVEDPYAYMSDETPSRVSREQRGSVSMPHFDTDEHEIQEVPDTPTEDDDIEYQEGDTGVFLPAAEQVPYEEEEEIAGPASSLHIRPHSSRIQSREDVAPRRIDNAPEQDIQPHIDDQPTQVTPVVPIPMSPLPSQKPAAPARRSGALSPGKGPAAPAPRRSGTLQPGAAPAASAASRRSGTLQPNAAPSAPRRSGTLPTGARDRSVMTDATRQPGTSRVSQRPTLAPSAARSQGMGRAPGQQIRQPARPRVASASSSGRSRMMLLIAAIVLILLVGSLAMFVPTANVVLTLQPRTYTHALHLVARSDALQSSAPGTVASQLQTHTFTQSGLATATGSKQVGRAAATGTVTITNNGKQPVNIPTGTKVSTPSGIQFTTEADLVITPPGQPGNQVPVPVQAVNKGDNGNLPADTITVIPQDSLNAIAQDNNTSATSLALQVANNQPTTGGGLATVHTILQQDLDTAKKNLIAQLQPAINTWLKQWTTNGIASKPTINATLVGSPQDGQIVNSTSVPVTLSAAVSVLVVSNANLQKAAITQLDASLRNDPNYQDYVIATDHQPAVAINAQKVASNDATTLTITANASAQAVRAITQDDVRKEITGMTAKDAQQMLSQQPGIENVDISVSPGADPWLPLWSANTHVAFQVGTTK